MSNQETHQHDDSPRPIPARKPLPFVLKLAASVSGGILVLEVLCGLFVGTAPKSALFAVRVITICAFGVLAVSGSILLALYRPTCKRCGKSYSLWTSQIGFGLCAECAKGAQEAYAVRAAAGFSPLMKKEMECPGCRARGCLENYTVFGQVPFNYWWACSKCGLVFSEKTLLPVPALVLLLARWGVAIILGLAIAFYAWLFRH